MFTRMRPASAHHGVAFSLLFQHHACYQRLEPVCGAIAASALTPRPSPCLLQPLCKPFCGTVQLTTRLSSALPNSIKPGSEPEDVIKRVSKGDVQINFARSGGAGGQNVNKVNTKVDMRLDLGSEWISEEMRDALQRLEKKRINKEGELVLTSQRTRSQADNVEDALEKMQGALDRAAESIIPPKPDPLKAKEIKKRKEVANEHRIQNKKAKSEKKSMRRGKIEW